MGRWFAVALVGVAGLLVFVATAGAPETAVAADPLAPRTLGPGFEYGRWKLPVPSPLGDSTLRFVRFDPASVRLEVRAASLGDGRIRAARDWARDDRVPVAVTNTSMFASDWLSSVGRLVVAGRAQREAWAALQNSLLLADPVGAGPRARLANLGCEDREQLASGWKTQVQSIRMVGCDGANVWAQEARSWSSALVGADRSGRILFLHTRSPYTMHDLVDMLLASPLDIVALHYGEGGPEASLYVRAAGFEEVNVGSFETGFVSDDANAQEWELPNVVVAVGGG